MSDALDNARDALIEGVKIDARNAMRHDSRVWHEALEAALDKLLPAFWDAAMRATTASPTDDEREALIAEADALVESWDRKGSWSPDSPVGMVMQLADALRRQGPVTVTDERADWAIAEALRQSDDKIHEDLCACGSWPESCVTYGSWRGWSHDAEYVARAVLTAALTPDGNTGDTNGSTT